MYTPPLKGYEKINIIRQFTPNWFTVNMGTGIVALILSELSFIGQFINALGATLWLINALLFMLFLSLYLLRWLFYWSEAKLILNHSSMLFFLGAIPMALATILNGGLKYGVAIFGNDIIHIIQVLWYIDALLAVFIAFFVPAMMFTRQQHQLENMTAIWLLPIVAAEVTASSGGLLLGFIQDPQQSLTILICSYMLWGLSVLPAFTILTILFLKLALHKLPEQNMAISSCLALGPIGTGALALLLIGKQAGSVLTLHSYAAMGEAMHYTGIMAAMLLIGFGFWWFTIALFTVYKHLGKGFTFNLGWWGLTFPLGVYTFAILELGYQLQFLILIHVGYGLSVVLILLWVIVAYKTILGAYQGILFNSPCLVAALHVQKAKQ